MPRSYMGLLPEERPPYPPSKKFKTRGTPKPYDLKHVIAVCETVTGQPWVLVVSPLAKLDEEMTRARDLFCYCIKKHCRLSIRKTHALVGHANMTIHWNLVRFKQRIKPGTDCYDPILADWYDTAKFAIKMVRGKAKY